MSDNHYVTPEKLFAKKPVTRYVDVEVQGHKFHLQSWSAREAARYNKAMRDKTKRPKSNEHMIALTVVNPETKELMFNEEHVDQLHDMDIAFIGELVKECLGHIGAEFAFEDEGELGN